MNLTSRKQHKGTQGEFGYEWAIYRDILPMHREQFVRWIGSFPISGFQGKHFMDAGCGMGRNSYWALEAGAKSGYAFDYDIRSVAAARENLGLFPNCKVDFRSIYNLDFKGEFDIVFSIGVIHHLADPASAVRRLVEALKPGGTLILWVYGFEGNETYLRVVNPLRQYLTALLPKPVTHWFATFLTVLLWGYLRLPHRKPYLHLLRRMSFKHLEAIVFDQLLPTIAEYWRREEVRKLVDGLPLANLRLEHTNGMSWTLLAEKVKSRVAP